MSANHLSHEPTPEPASPQPVLARLTTLRDLLRVRAHLAAQEARDALGQIDAQLEGVEQRLRQAMRALEEHGDEAELQMHLAWLEARERLERVSPPLQDLAHMPRAGFYNAAGAAAEAWDSARLQAHLGAMDAADAWQSFVEQRRQHFQHARQEAQREGERAARDVLDWLNDLQRRWQPHTRN